MVYASEIAEIIARQFWRLVAVFLIVTGVIGFLLLSRPDVYEARTLLLYKLGRDYIYVPDADDTNARAPDPGDLQLVVNAEMQILNSAGLKRDLIERIGPTVVYPWLEGHPEPMVPAFEMLNDAVNISLITGSYVVRLGVFHGDPQMATDLSTGLVDLYMTRRAEIFRSEDAASLRAQLAAAEARGREIDAEIAALLDGRHIMTFDAGTEILTAEYGRLRQDLAAADAELNSIARQQELLAREMDTNPLMSAQAETRGFELRLAKAEQESRRAYLLNEIEENRAELAGQASQSGQLEVLRQKRNLQTTQIASIYSRLQDVAPKKGTGTGDETNVRIIEPPTPIMDPVGLPKKVRLVIAAFIGAIAAGAVLLAALFVRQNVTTAPMTQHRLRLPVLGEVERRSRRELKALTSA